MGEGPTGGKTLARIGNAVVALGLIAGAAVAVVAEYVFVGVALGAFALVLIPGIIYPKYNFLWVAIDLAWELW